MAQALPHTHVRQKHSQSVKTPLLLENKCTIRRRQVPGELADGESSDYAGNRAGLYQTCSFSRPNCVQNTPTASSAIRRKTPQSGVEKGGNALTWYMKPCSLVGNSFPSYKLCVGSSPLQSHWGDFTRKSQTEACPLVGLMPHGEEPHGVPQGDDSCHHKLPFELLPSLQEG